MTNLKPTSNLIAMKAKQKAKINARNKREAEQARRVVNGIFIGLIAMVVIFICIYYYFFN